MCGIAGFCHHSGLDGIDFDPGLTLRRMTAQLRHRGPDGQGAYLDDMVGLGHARLSIIDAAGGAQPMANDQETLLLTFNGEIFNYIELRKALGTQGHRFRTQSDTEVILRQYEQSGLDCVDAFNGDFAFGLWDRPRRRLMLARDRMGVRPLYYTLLKNTLVFASEIKSLLQFPGVRAEIDLEALDQCFTFWFPIAPKTPFKGIHELPPGHVLTFDRGRVVVRPYWRLAFPHATERQVLTARGEQAIEEELYSLLLDATKLRLRSDVPVGSYVSGGLDSAITTALIRQIAPDRLRTFAVRFESREFDETAFQEQVVSALDTDHRAFVCANHDIGCIFPQVIAHAERPILRTAPAPMLQLASLVRQYGYKVVLTGEGADEILAGYDIFKEAKIRRFWARQPHSTLRPRLLRRLYPYMAGIQSQSQAYLEAFFGVGLDRPEDPFFSHLPRWGTTAAIKQMFAADTRASLAGYDALEELRAGLPAEYYGWHPLSRAQYLETAHLLPGYILSAQGDRMTMAHGVEGRFPFLDHRVVEFAAQIPPQLKLKGLREKHILRRSMSRHLPATIADRPKQPYRAPEGVGFFDTQPPDYVEALLSTAAIERTGYFDARPVGRLVQKFRNGAATGVRDNMALVGILSVQLLDHLFVRQETGM